MNSRDIARRCRQLDPESIPEVAEWLHMVEDGLIVSCEEQRLVCAMVRRIFADEDLFLDNLEKLMDMAYANREAQIRSLVEEVVTTYHPPKKN